MDPAHRWPGRLWRSAPGDHLSKGYTIAFAIAWLAVTAVAAVNGVEDPTLTGLAGASLAMLPISTLHLGLKAERATGLRRRLLDLADHLDRQPHTDAVLIERARDVVDADDPQRSWTAAEIELGLLSARDLRRELSEGTVSLAGWVVEAIDRTTGDRRAYRRVWERELRRRLRARDPLALAALADTGPEPAWLAADGIRSVVAGSRRSDDLLAALADDVATATFVAAQDVEGTDPAEVADDLERHARRRDR